MTEQTVAHRLSIRGRVQGVGYRDWLCREARARGVVGWVRNRRDGSVEALLHGDAAAVAELLAACRRGPPAAAVTALDAHPAEPPAEAEAAQGFRWLPTQ